MTNTTRIDSFQHQGLTFDVIDTGPLDGKPVVLLHGFPETNKIWQQTSEILNANGFRTYAMNQRGYSLGAQPKGRSAYRTSLLVADVIALLDQIAQPVYLIGHDWGAVVAWEVARAAPNKIKHLIPISVPHKAAFLRAFLSSDQAFKSYYIYLFQLPKLPELLFNKIKPFSQKLLKSTGMTAAQLEDFQQEMVAENRLPFALNWYRAAWMDSPRHLFTPVEVPTLFIFGKHDVAISIKGVDYNPQYVKAPYQQVILDSTHWIPVQNASELTAHILQHIAA